MMLFTRIASTLRSLFRKEALDRDLDDELRSYLDQVAGEKIGSGMTRSAAYREARIELGGVEQVKENVRDRRLGAHLDVLHQDVRYAFRSMRKNLGFTATCIAVLAVGIGANAAMFSVVDSVLLEPLPYPEADRLVWMWSLTPDGNTNSVAALDYTDYREASETVGELAAYSLWRESYVITGGDAPEVLTGAAVSSNFFRTLLMEPVIGRGFLAGDEDPESGSPVVLSHGLWQRRFGGDPGVLGQTVSLEGQPVEIVGVMPQGFAFPQWAELWRPFRMSERMAQGRGNNNMLVFGRLVPGMTVEQASEEFAVMAAGIAAEYPDDKEDWSAQMVPIVDVFVGTAGTVLWVLLAVVGLTLLIACANVAALLLARAGRRQGEMAMRLAIGASRGRIARQVLTESLVLAAVGAVLGLAVAFGALRALAASGGSALPRLAEVEMDATALLFTFGLAILTGLLFGLAPALRAPSLDLAEAIKGGQRRSRRPGGLGLQSGLVVGQVALSMVLLVGAGLLIRSFVEMQRVEMGFEARGVLTARLQLPGDAYGSERPPNEFYEAALARVRALPGVEDAGIITRLPVAGGGGPWNYVHAESRPPVTPADRKGATRRVASPGYFEAMGIEVLSGRTFDAGDAEDGSEVVVISRALQQELFPGEDPVGRSLVLSGWDPPVHLEIVGVVGDARVGSLDSDGGQTMYWPLSQNHRLSVSISVRTQGDPAAIAPLLREAIHETDPNASISEVQPMRDIVSASLAQNRFRTVLLGAFAGLAVLLASLGLYGVLAQLVGGRTRELGVRIAVGARAPDILGLVMKSGLRLAFIGIGIGLLGGTAVAYVASSLLFNVRPLDPMTYGATGLVLLLVALAASAIPAWNASRVDPVNSLRAE